MAGPGIPKNARRDGYVYLYDLFPTLCTLCEMEIPQSVEGNDFSDTFENSDASLREEIYAAYADKIRTIKNSRYKLIEYRFQKVNVTQLFDLVADPLETFNLADDPSYAKIRHELSMRLIDHGKNSGEMKHSAGINFWSRYVKDPNFVEPEVLNWKVTMYKPDK
jgi:arylsulfatase A-like enzyme